MFPVLVPTTRPTTREALDEMIDKLGSVFEDVRRKAFESFLTRGEKFGSDMEDWFRAERELFKMPESALKDTENEFEIRAAVPGFKADDLHVQVLPELIVVEAKTETKKPAEEVKGETKTPPETKKTEGEKIHFSEFESKRLFRQYRLPAPIDVKEVQATLDAGMLKIVARKQQVVPAPKAIEVPIQTEVVKAPPVALAAGAK
jgi:HSP20 family molecular chaperone IbpA